LGQAATTNTQEKIEDSSKEIVNKYQGLHSEKNLRKLYNLLLGDNSHFAENFEETLSSPQTLATRLHPLPIASLHWQHRTKLVRIPNVATLR